MKLNGFIKSLIVLAAITMIVISCRPLSRNNPVDPTASNYIGMTYKGDQWYPPEASITSMVWANGLVLGSYDATNGDTVIRVSGSSALFIGGTGVTTGYFNNINDLAADPAGNVYIVDSTGRVQVMDPGNSITSWSLTYTTLGTFSIEYISGDLFVTNTADKTIQKYSTAGTLLDSRTVTVTSRGYFTPGRIFGSGTTLYVINKQQNNDIYHIDTTFAVTGDMSVDGNATDGVGDYALCETLVQAVGAPISANLVKWGDFGDGAGKVMNGQFIAYDGAQFYIYDESLIKTFGK
jgi:hypothetical protein